MENINAGALQPTYRIRSIDLLRGVVMIIMALDHVRDYFHWSAEIYNPTDLTRTSIPIFFTRWITHFCAPVFVFLAGTSAFLVGTRKGRKALSGFLLKRGLWLILLELVVVNFGWFFNIEFSAIVLQTIWALGIGMIALSGLVYLQKQLILVISLLLIFGHNLLDNVHVAGQDAGALGWSMLHELRLFFFPSFVLLVAYPVIPWIGLMAAGYCLGEVYTANDHQKRRRLLLYFGFAAIVLFIVLRLINGYGDLRSWSAQNTPAFTFLSFLNVTKYPPSLCYILVTIGPALVFLALAEKPAGRLANVISVFGRVPLFYYILHIYFIHLGAMLVAQLTGFGWKKMILQSFPGDVPELRGYGFPLWTVYIIWITLIVILYPLCRWYDQYKSANRQKWWLSYL